MASGTKTLASSSTILENIPGRLICGSVCSVSDIVIDFFCKKPVDANADERLMW
jgi:hypothetical protein